MLNHKTYVETHLKPNEKVVLNTETTAKGLIVTWLAFPGAAIKIAGQILVLIGNYAISKWLIFRKK